MTSRHVSVWIDAAPEVAYAIAADPEQLPRWASGLAESGLRQTADGWVADSPMGEVIVEFAPPTNTGCSTTWCGCRRARRCTTRSG